MTRYSVQPRDRIFSKSYEFLYFIKDVGKNHWKNISNNLNSKYSQKLLDHAKQSATDALKIASGKQFKQQQKQLTIWFVIKLLTKLHSLKSVSTE